jgi:hypothetical protein
MARMTYLMLLPVSLTAIVNTLGEVRCVLLQ